MDKNKLDSILKEHLSDANLSYTNLRGANLSYANLRGVDLSYTNLRGVDLSYANLSYANLKYADLSDADLRGANLRGADLSDAELRGADLRGDDLRGTDLRGADLRGADLRGADLRGADLRGADLRGVKNLPFIPFTCPDSGSFIGYKKANNYIVKLEILEDARRCSSTGRKCRCDKARVLSITNLDGTDANVSSVSSYYDKSFIYKVGEVVEVPDFDTDRWNECSAGIHFFINRQEAVEY